MSKKPLLNENTVRQFMKYANLGKLSDNFINETYMEDMHKEGMYQEDEDPNADVAEEGMMDMAKKAGGMALKAAGGAVGGAMGGPVGAMAGKALAGKGADALGLGEEEDGMAPMDDDMDDMGDMGDEAPMDDMGDMGDEAPSTELPPEAVSALEQAVEAAADAMLDALAPFGVEGEASVEGDEAPMDDMDDMDDMGDEDLGVDVEMDDQDIVAETMKRVMQRLKLMKESKKAESKKNDMINSVADAIVTRLRRKK
tara:strand:+ start:292 stop:1056 length:765 start_codon:yes stop_codon:yes gene_type:complete